MIVEDRKIPEKNKKTLDKSGFMLYYIGVAARPGIRSAAIAQPVERILGKDEVTSSNLVSSSKKYRAIFQAKIARYFCALRALPSLKLPFTDKKVKGEKTEALRKKGPPALPDLKRPRLSQAWAYPRSKIARSPGGVDQTLPGKLEKREEENEEGCFILFLV